MKQNVRKLIAMVLAVMLAFSVISTSAFAAGINASKAEKIALSDAGLKRSDVTMKKTQLERDDGKTVYEVEFFIVRNGMMKEYEYEINADTGKIVDKSIDIDSFVPANVTGLRVVGVAKNSVRLSWNGVRDVDGYVVYKYNSAKKTYKKVATTRSTSYNVKSLKAGTSAVYAVRAFNKENGRTGYSSKYTTIKVSTLTNAPKNVSASSSKGRVKVTWAKVTGAKSYIVRWSNSFGLKESVSVKKTNVTIKGLPKKSTVTVTVTAVNADGRSSALSKAVKVTVK